MTPLKRQLQGSSALWGGSVRDPITVGNLILSTIGVQTSSILLIQAVGYIATTLITSWAMNALTPKPELPDLSANSGRVLRNDRDVAAPHRIVYGEARVGGAVTYLESTGEDNKYLHMVIALAGHEVQEIGTIYINDAPVNLDAGGFVTTGDWTDGDGNPKVRVNKHLGAAGQTADADLLAESNIIDSDFRGRGIAYLYVRLEYDRDVFASGIPTFTAVVKGKKVYDPRSDSTGWSANAALCVRDYLASGYGLGDGNIDDTMFATAANVCDEAVSLAGGGGGSEPRYEINGSFTLDQAPGKVLQRMMTACGGMLFFGGGQWKLKPGYYAPPVKTFTLDDLRGPITLDTRVPRRDTFNVVRGTFIDAGQDWITADYPEVYGSGFVTEDGNLENPIDLELPFTTSKAAAQRIAKLTLFRGREQMSFQADFSLAAMEVEVGDIVALDNDRYGWDGKEFEVIGWRFAADQDAGDLRVRLTLRETSQAAFSWNAEENDIIGNDTNLPDFRAGLAISNLTASGGGRTQADGTFINSVILDWDDVSNAFLDYYEVQWRALTDSVFNSATTSESGLEISPVVDGVEYLFRVRAVTPLGNKGPLAEIQFTGGGDVTAPALPTDVSAEGGFRYITVQWTNPADADLNYVEVFENTSNTSAGATQVGISSGDNFVRTNLGLNQTRFYFLRAVDYSGNKSAFTAGVSATTTFLDDPDFENGIRTLFEDQGLYAIEDVSGLPASGDFVGQKVFNRQDGKLYEWNGSQWVLVISAVEAPDISGQIETNQIAVNAVTNALIANDAVQQENIQNLAVNADKIADNAVVTSKIANSAVQEANLANGAATEAKIATNAITETKISSGAVTTPKVAAGAITAGEIAAGSIETSKIAAGAVTAGEIATGTITSNEIATNTITAGNVAAGTITSSEIATGTITATNIAADAITTSELAAGAVTTPKIAAGAVTANEITAGTITSNEISTGTITANEIAGSTITGDKIVANTITGGLLATSGIITSSAQIDNAVVTNAKIANGAITTAKIGDAQITSAKIGSLQVKSANIDNLTVGTTKITGNAVSNAASNTTVADRVSSFTRTASISTISGAQLVLLLDATGAAADEGGGQSATLTVKLNGSTIYTISASRGEFVELPVFLLQTSSTTGTVTLTVEGTSTGGAGATDVSFNQCAIIGLKK